MKTSSHHSPRVPSRSRLRRGGFTMVEILVAVAIMSLLLSIIFVPLRLGFETTHIGKVNSDLQQQGHVVIQQIANDLRKSQFVFPNARKLGVTEQPNAASSCSTAAYREGVGVANANDWNFQPYIIADTSSLATQGSPHQLPVANPPVMNFGVCSAVTNATGTTKGVKSWSNPARLDMLQMRRDNNGATSTSKAGQDFIVSYYFRRLNITPDAMGNIPPYDPIDNPIQLFRAQIPYRNRVSGGPNNFFTLPNNRTSDTEVNAQIDWVKYPASIGSCNIATEPTQTNRSFAWITHNFYGEANLEPLTRDAKGPNDTMGLPVTGAETVPGAHTLVTPSDMGLYAPRAETVDLAGNRVAEAFVPELSFTQEAVNGGRINRVTISLTMAKYDEGGSAAVNGQGKSLKQRVTQTVDLPNAGCSN